MKTGKIIWLASFLIWTGPIRGQINEKRVLSETNHQIYHAAFSPDGKYMVTTGSDNNIIIWNAESGGTFRTLAGSKKRPNSAVFSRDGEVLFSAGEEGVIHSWDIFQVRITNTATGHTGPIKALDISPDGTLLASGGADRIVRVWGISGDGLTLVYELKGHKRDILALAFSPGGSTLVSGGADRSLITWDVRNGTMTREMEDAHGGWIRCMALSPDGRYLATGGDDNLVIIRNISDLSLFKTLEGHTDWVQTLAYTRSGNFIISGGHDQYIRVWDVGSGQEVARSDRLEQVVLSVAASPLRNDFISSCLLSDQLRIWAYGTASTNLQSSETLPAEDPAYPEEDRPPTAGTETGIPSIQLFSPEPLDGQVIHERATILIIGKADAPGGIQTLLINRERAELTESGIFQKELALVTGENRIDLAAISNTGKLARSSFTILCTDPGASTSTAEQPEAPQGVYHALIIGIDDYLDEEIPDLDFPIADADSLYRTLLHHYSFSEEHMHFLKNPGRSEIIIAMDELSRSVNENDNLLIFYAGHGYWDEKSGIGYWLPHDASRGNTANWFRNSTLRDFIGSIPSRHTLLIADACFSGSIFKTRSAFSEEVSGVQKLHELPSRKAMTSGALKEVPDKSVFIRYLIRELNSNEATLLPSEELFGRFRTAVLNNSPTVPQFGTIQNAGDEGGDFIFVRK